MKKKQLSNNTPREIAGWTLVRNQYELTEFEDHNYISYRGRATSFPCLVREIIASDENGETYILTLENVRDMFALLNQPKGEG